MPHRPGVCVLLHNSLHTAPCLSSMIASWPPAITSTFTKKNRGQNKEDQALSLHRHSVLHFSVCHMSQNLDSQVTLKECTHALARWFSWLECRPVHQKVAGSIPSQGVCGRQPIHVSLSHWFSLSLSLSVIYPWVRIKNILCKKIKACTQALKMGFYHQRRIG